MSRFTVYSDFPELLSASAQRRLGISGVVLISPAAKPLAIMLFLGRKNYELSLASATKAQIGSCCSSAWPRSLTSVLRSSQQGNYAIYQAPLPHRLPLGLARHDALLARPLV